MTFIKLKKFGLENKRASKKLRKKRRDLPKAIGNMAKRHFREGFRKGGFTDTAFEKWEPRRKRLSRTRTSDRLKERANLIKSGALRRSVLVRSANWRRIKIGTRGVKYAARHNFGLAGMPKRQFIGDSKVLEKRIKKRITKELKDVFKR